mgnify:CR=1 FL=1
MYRSHNCGELRASHINTEVTLAGWVQKSRDKGFMNWVDLRDRYGITQLIFDESRTEKTVFELAKTLEQAHIVTFGGAYSNHLVATAVAGKLFGIKTTGFVRGDEIRDSNAYELCCQDHGMQLIHVNRSQYRQKQAKKSHSLPPLALSTVLQGSREKE